MKKQGQILLITLLVLVVMALTIIGLLMIINRDVQSVGNNQKYEQIYNVVENNLIQMIKVYGDPTKSISELPTDSSFAGWNCASVVVDLEYKCSVLSTDYGIVNVQTDISIVDAYSLTDVKLDKDIPYTINLSGYESTLNLSWDRDIALEFLLIYRKDDGTINYVSETYNPANILTSPQNYNAFTDSSNLYSLAYLINNPGNQTQSVSINLANTYNYNVATYSTISLTITPRLNTADTIKMNISPSTTTGYPFQLRTFLGEGVDPEDPKSPGVKIQSVVPLYAQTDGFLNYSLLSKDFIL